MVNAVSRWIDWLMGDVRFKYHGGSSDLSLSA